MLQVTLIIIRQTDTAVDLCFLLLIAMITNDSAKKTYLFTMCTNLTSRTLVLRTVVLAS